VSGFDLQAYVFCRISSDHETSRREEGLEKIKAGHDGHDPRKHIGDEPGDVAPTRRSKELKKVLFRV